MSEIPLNQYEAHLEAARAKLQEMPTLAMMVMCILEFVRCLAVSLLEEELRRRAIQPEVWPKCQNCGRTLRSKGFRKRKILTLFGWVQWERRVGCCPGGCRDSQTIPLDKRLDLRPNQRTGNEVKRLACMLVIFVPFETACVLLRQLTGIALSPDTLWTWCQEAGQRISCQIQAELQAMEAGKQPELEALEGTLKGVPLVIGADGVMVPIRPQAGTPAGKTIWREVKVGILARLTQRLTRKGENVSRLQQRRVVAVMGSVDEFMPALQLEAGKQGISEAERVVWLCDGGKGFWRIFETWLKPLLKGSVTGVLDFYHAAQNLFNAAKTWLDGRTARCREWFSSMRHKLRHGQEKDVITELDNLLNSEQLPDSAKEVVHNTYHYLKRHEQHIHYQEFKDSNLPIGSGLVESACKWLIQQRFKGVGMRWSENGFNTLLYLRVSWVNQRFDDFFPLMDPSPS